MLIVCVTNVDISYIYVGCNYLVRYGNSAVQHNYDVIIIEYYVLDIFLRFDFLYDKVPND